MSIVELAGRLICTTDDEATIVLRDLCRHMEVTRAEAGCLRFDVEPTDDPLVWAVSERFVDQAALDAHQARVRSSEWGRVTSGIKRDYVINVVDDGA